MNHDALFKTLLKRPAIFKGFFDAFLPQVGEFIDFGSLEFVDKERITADGRKRTGDLLAKACFRGETAGFLIHFEHQAQPDPDLARRMLEYWLLDWREYDLPVYPIAVLSHKQSVAGLDAPLEIRFPNKRVLQFDYDVIDLPKMDAGSFVQMHNPAALALAARMKSNPQESVRLTRDFIVSLAETPIEEEDQKLVTNFFAKYQTLTPQQTLQLRRKLGKVKPDSAREAVMNLTNPFIEMGKYEGLRQGRREGEAEIVIRQLARRLGALSTSQEKAVRKLSTRKLEGLAEALLDFSSIDDLTQWMRETKKR